MITSGLISECRREYGDIPQSVRVARNGDGTVNTFNTGKFPILENTYTVKKAGVALTENAATSGFTINLDNGDILLTEIPGNVEISADFQTAEWRDKNWLEAINGSISHLNGRGFFKQIVREAITLPANSRSFAAPSGAVDAYELLQSPANSTPVPLRTNWSYQQDANSFVLGNPLTSTISGAVSYLRNLRTYSATSATLDVKDDWMEILKKRTGATFYRSLAGKTAQEGNASISDGHISFTNMRVMSKDLEDEFERLAQRKKPTRPAKNIQFSIDGSGPA